MYTKIKYLQVNDKVVCKVAFDAKDEEFTILRISNTEFDQRLLFKKIENNEFVDVTKGGYHEV